MVSFYTCTSKIDLDHKKRKEAERIHRVHGSFLSNRRSFGPCAVVRGLAQSHMQKGTIKICAILFFMGQLSF